jgi:hypothetical protein
VTRRLLLASIFVPVLIVLAMLAAAARAAGGAGATSPAPRLLVGIADQKPDMFGDPRFAALGVRHARLTVAWDALSSDWQVAELDRWMSGARARGVEPLISFGHSRINRRALPSPERLRFELRRFRARYPWVTTFATWNEANHCGEPTCNRPRLVAAYYRALRRECPTCIVLGAELLDMPNLTSWTRRFRRALGFTPAVFGLHNYVEANRFTSRRLARLLRAIPGAKLWLTETGGLVRRRNKSTTDIPEGVRHATLVTRYIFDRVVPRFDRITRVYLYHWNAGPPGATWDSALITANGRIRPSLSVLDRVLRRGLRPSRTPRRAPKGTKPPAATAR